MIAVECRDAVDGAAALRQVTAIAERHPGERLLAICVGNRTLLLGEPWRVDGSPECCAALAEFGDVKDRP